MSVAQEQRKLLELDEGQRAEIRRRMDYGPLARFSTAPDRRRFLNRARPNCPGPRRRR